MGFLSGLGGILGGGSSGSSQETSRSGWALLPPEIQNAYKGFATQVTGQLPNAATAYKPMPQTADETAAINRIRQGFTPTQDSLNSDIGMLMNPFDNYVVNDINRQAQGDFSILKQNMNQAGQFGSNRQQLGANDIENTRLNNIGTLRQNQYNQALGQVFNNLIPQRENDTQGLLGIGNFQRGLDTATNSAGITGLQQLAQALRALPNSGGSSSNQSSDTSSSQNGILDNIGSAASSLFDFFS